MVTGYARVSILPAISTRPAGTYSRGITAGPLKGVACASLDGGWDAGELESALGNGVRCEQRNADN